MYTVHPGLSHPFWDRVHGKLGKLSTFFINWGKIMNNADNFLQVTVILKKSLLETCFGKLVLRRTVSLHQNVPVNLGIFSHKIGKINPLLPFGMGLIFCPILRGVTALSP